MKHQKSLTSSILLIVAILILINILSDNFFFRLDFTQDNRYTMSRATKNILSALDEPVTITAYFTQDLPPDVAKTRRDFKELLVEYASLSKGNVVFEFIDPAKDTETEQKAMQAGIQPVIVNVRERDQVKQQKVYLGAYIRKGEQSDVIPFMKPGVAMEYALSSSIKKLSVINKPTIAFLQGNGEPTLDAYQQVMASLTVLYNVEPLDMNDSLHADLNRFKTIAVVGTKDTLPEYALQQLDNYLANGGNLLIAMNRVEGDFTTAQGRSVETGLENWLIQKGIIVENSFVIDQNCGSVSVRQQQANFTYTTQISFPFLPIITNFKEHPVTEGLEAVILQFASPISFTGDTSLNFKVLAKTSAKSGTQHVPLFFNINKRWNESDFPLSNLTVAATLEGNITGNVNSRILIVSDGDFAVSGSGRQAQQVQPDNVSLMVNSIDWLSDDTGLIELRTKGVTARPLDQIEDGKKMFLKWLNFLLPILIIVVYGIIRMQYNRNLRIKRMEVGYV